MEATPISGVDELDHHLDQLVEDPDLPLDAKLFDDVELQLTESNIPPLIPRLLPKLTTILKQYNQDPAILASLSIKLLGPVTFTQVLSLASEDSLIQALRSPAPSANLLAISVLAKAARSPTDAAILSTLPALVCEFVRRWLVAPQVEVGQRGGMVLGDLLDVDCELPPPPPPQAPEQNTQLVLRKAPGHGKLWRRVFRDHAVYGLIVGICAGRDAATAGDENQLSLAQGRLLRVLPRLAALDFRAVAASDFAAPQPAHATNGGGSGPTPRSGEGLLQFAALRMVDRRDVLMALSLVDFFEALVSLMRVSEYSAYKVETLRGLLREAVAADDGELRTALLSLPDRTVPEETDALKTWLREIMPGEAMRVDRHWS